MTYISRIRVVLFAAFLALTVVSLALPSSSEAAVLPQTTTASQIVPASIVTKVAKASTIRLAAMHKAKTQAGKWYSWGAAGPNAYDCSGLVMWAYNSLGKKLPHNTGDMLGSGRLQRVSASQVRWGDLAFYGTGHVELFGHFTNKAKTAGVTFGAHKSGTRISYRSFNGYYHPTAYYRVK